MKRYAEKLVTEVKRHVCVELICDACNKTCPDPDQGNWSTDFDCSKTVTFLLRHSWGADSSVDGVDLCPNCAETLMEAVQDGRVQIILKRADATEGESG